MAVSQNTRSPHSGPSKQGSPLSNSGAHIPPFAGFRAPRICTAVTAILALVITLWMLHGAFTVTTSRSFIESFTFAPQTLIGDPSYFMLGGWRDLPPIEKALVPDAYAGDQKQLALLPGDDGILIYRFAYRPGEKAHLELEARNDDDIATSAVLQPPDGKLHALPLPRGTQPSFIHTRIDLTPYLSGGHGFYLNLESKRKAGSAIAAQAIRDIRFDFEAPSPPRIRIGSCIFFSTICFICWWAFLGYIIPQALGVIRIFRIRYKMKIWEAMRLLCIGFVLFSAAVLIRNERWNSSKIHDDLWALGNARLLGIDRFNTSDLFFRSRVRPGFLAFALPLQLNLPQTITSISKTPSDFKQRLFFVFDRLNGTWGFRIYSEMSILALLAALAGVLLVGRIVLAVDVGKYAPLRAAIAIGFSAWFLGIALGTPLVSVITLAITWTYILAAMLAFVQACRVPSSVFHWVIAGTLTGVAVLFKEDAFSIVLPMFCYLIYLLMRKQIPLPRVILFLGFSALLPLIYYAFIIDKGFAEIFLNFSQHLQSRNLPAENKLVGYNERTIGGMIQGFGAVFGMFWPLVAAFGLWHISRRRPLPAKGIFFILWFLGGCTAFLLPYFYPRFLIYMIPSVAWFVGCGIVAFGKRGSGRVARRKQT